MITDKHQLSASPGQVCDVVDEHLNSER